MLFIRDFETTSKLSWVKHTLLEKYPGIRKDSGADLDQDGVIKGKECFGDLNADNKIDDNDFWLYLERNKELIRKDIPLILGSEDISPKNIFHTILFIEEPDDKETKRDSEGEEPF